MYVRVSVDICYICMFVHTCQLLKIEMWDKE